MSETELKITDILALDRTDGCRRPDCCKGTLAAY